MNKGRWGMDREYVWVCECQCACVLPETNTGSHVVSERGLDYWSMQIDQDSSQLTETHCKDSNIFFPQDMWKPHTTSANLFLM